MRILYLVTAYPRRPGEVITPWLTETIGRLAGRGIEVEVLAPSYRGLGDQVIDGVRVHRFRYAPARIETLTHDQTTPDRIRERPHYLGLVPGYVVAGCAAAVRLTRGGRFDAVHAFWPVPHGLFALAARRLNRVPVVCTFFGVELTWVRRDLPGLRPVVRQIIRRSDAVTVISRHTAREIERLVPEARVRTIPFGAAVALDESPPGSGAFPAPDGAEIGRRFDTDFVSEAAEPFRLLFVGRLVERKGVSVLLRALAAIRERRDVRLTIVGDGPLRAALVAEAAGLGLGDAVEFTGFVSAGELSKRYRTSDAFVLPAVEDSKGDVEGLGVVLIEAILHDRPVVASASGGIPDIVIDGVTGLLSEPGDPLSLAAAIERLIADPGRGRRLLAAAREHIATHFSWDGIIDQLQGVYSEVTGSVTAPASPAAQ